MQGKSAIQIFAIERKLGFPKGWTKVVVVGGILDNPDLSLDDVEALESEDGGRNCLELPEYPVEAHFAVLANIGGRAVVCGGFNLVL